MYDYRRLTPEQREALVKERLAHGYPPHDPPHTVRDRTLYLLTASCYEHQCYMTSPDRRCQVLDKLYERFTLAGMTVLAWVILPNHYHLLVDEVDLDRVGEILKSIHGGTSFQWNSEESKLGRKVWFRYTDRAIRSDRHFFTTLNYIHYNPVKHGWTASPYDWHESSVQWYRETMGREWLRDLWVRYPVRNYGKGWDEMLESL